MRRRSDALAIAALSLALAAACNKGPADSVLTEAEGTLAEARADLERYAPGELAAIEAALRSARADFGRGRYTDALRVGQEMPAQIEAALTAAKTRREGLAAEWKGLSEGASGLLRSIADRLAALAAAAPPPGPTSERLEAARAELASIRQAWAEAAAAFEGGDVAGALERGTAAKARAEALAAALRPRSSRSAAGPS